MTLGKALEISVPNGKLTPQPHPAASPRRLTYDCFRLRREIKAAGSEELDDLIRHVVNDYSCPFANVNIYNNNDTTNVI